LKGGVKIASSQTRTCKHLVTAMLKRGVERPDDSCKTQKGRLILYFETASLCQLYT